jgi:hypothetical protein
VRAGKYGKDEEAQQLVQELREHAHRLQQHKGSEDPRESFNTSEFSNAAKTFVDNLRSNFGRHVHEVMPLCEAHRIRVCESIFSPLSRAGLSSTPSSSATVGASPFSSHSSSQSTPMASL